MGFFSILFIAIGLGMDAFAVAIGTGVVIRKLSFGHVFRLSFHFGLFQFFMPIIGWLIGGTVSNYMINYGHWIAFCLLVWIGGKMIRDSFKETGKLAQVDPTRGMRLILLSVATSIDALAVGISFAFLNITILYPSIIIGIVASIMTITGMMFGESLRKIAGKKVGILGGFILIGIGIKILIEHLFLF